MLAADKTNCYKYLHKSEKVVVFTIRIIFFKMDAIYIYIMDAIKWMLYIPFLFLTALLKTTGPSSNASTFRTWCFHTQYSLFLEM